MSDYRYSRYASQTHYLPDDPDNWAVPPVDVKDALDKLAATAGNLAWQNPVEDKDVTDPSTLTPSAGDRYIVAAGGVGVWSGKDNDLAEWDGTQWDFDTPTEGFACEVLDEDQYYAFTGTSWITLPDFVGAAKEADFKTGRQAIGAAATTAVVAFGVAYADTNYSITFTLLNVTDVGPAHFTALITAKAVGGFTVTLSGPTATVNYVLEWSTKHD